ncbi:GNAT family N-acetyltransferase [Nocardioides limicola]|uniref:GNAT family N-acetyltransferase n=1 Tax=Nocardioides limicola TaxID=2803368 RepID=UPI00193BCAF0|nr:GNAT family N-acetyltransferase [Nocardioides sp. DJM-14]
MNVTVTECRREDTALIEDWALIRAETDAEIAPEDPPIPTQELAAEFLIPRERARYLAWVAHVDGEPAGEVVLYLEDGEENTHLATVEWCSVRPRFRRLGVARALIRTALERATSENRTQAHLWYSPQLPGEAEAWFTRLGLTRGTVERCSRLGIASLDRDLMRRWVNDAATTAAGYRMVQFVNRCPEEYLSAYLDATDAMLDAPVDDLDYTIERTTAEELRQREQRWQAQNRVVVTSLVIAPDGSGAGFSELFVNGFRPQIGQQGDTGVAREHRGKRIGRWVKGANILLALEQHPELAVVETYNAESNPWMLDINVAMGFAPHISYVAHQGDVAVALNGLAAVPA